MKFIGDFHIHSHYSISTSKTLVPEELDYWARIKGISLIGIGDFTHPGWIKEIKEKLIPAEDGLFKLKENLRKNHATSIPSGSTDEPQVRFMLTSEISTIYKKHGKVRKVHNLIFAPDFETVERIQHELLKLGGNITSDGRPILGLDARDLLEIALNSSSRTFFIPAHIWTPWFSVLGDKSGFDTIEECYGDLADNIFAVETGLSSDPPMNWICSFLDKYTIISNSDAHSPEKLGREANLFDTDLSYDAIIHAIKSADPRHFLGTVEFFPQEGKYHYAGHRKCGVCWNPVETIKNKAICPVCGRKVTIGVMNRVAELADRDDITERKSRSPFYSLIPLKEILSEIMRTGPNTKQVNHAYNALIKKIGSEFEVLLNCPIDKLEKKSNEIIAEAVRRMRNKEIYIKEGFDGEYGQIKVFAEGEIKAMKTKDSLFKDLIEEKIPKRPPERKILNFNLEEYKNLKISPSSQPSEEVEKVKSQKSISVRKSLEELNPEQQKCARHFHGPALIIAGPGTGKTRVLTHRIAWLLQEKKVSPENILAVTFTNKAANEMKYRLSHLLQSKSVLEKSTILTFHSLGLSILKEYFEKARRRQNFSLIDEEDKERIIAVKMKSGKKHTRQLAFDITKIKQNLKTQANIKDASVAQAFIQYEALLKEQNAFDLDDLLYQTIIMFRTYPEILASYQKKYKWILVDEYQDINYAQYTLIKMLMPDEASNLCVIGDVNQAIYGFRGADIKFIKKFMNDYPGSAMYSLKTSYRCSGHILTASGNIIKNSSCLEALHKGVKITIAPNASDKSEAEYVARTIESMMGGLRFYSMDSDITEGNSHEEISSLSDFAVLARTKAQMKVIEKAFNDHSIPYQTVADDSFLRQEPIRSVITILKLAYNPDNSFLKDEVLDKKIITHHEIIELKNLLDKKGLQNFLTSIIDNYFLKERGKNEQLFKKLLTIAQDFGNATKAFLDFTALGIDVDMYKPNTENVTLMSLHAAKGLEFNCVFIVGCENGLIPYSLFENQQCDIDEERRLLYVGMTRAKKILFLTHAKKRFLFGRQYQLERSIFLDDIEIELTELHKSEYKRKETEEEHQLTLF